MTMNQQVMKYQTCTFVLVTITILRAISAAAADSAAPARLDEQALAGKWQGSFTPTSRLGTLQARVDLTRQASSSSGNLSGLWKGRFDKVGPSGRVTPAPFYITLQQEGTKLSGTAGPAKEEQVKIVNGRTNGAKILFEAPHDPSGPEMKFDLKLVNDHLEGTVRLDEKEEKVPSRPLWASLTQRGDKISGEIGFQGDRPLVVKEGIRKRDKVAISTDTDGLIIEFDLRLANDRMRGEARLEHDGHLIKAKVELRHEN